MSSDIASFVTQASGHQPKNAALFQLAFTHSSAGSTSYDRLEFLGDHVLGMVIALAVYDRYPKEPEGDLSRRYNALVARETCADIGRDLGIQPLIRLGKQARDDGASESDNVVGDVVEALIGALFIDAGIELASRFVLQAWRPYLDGQGRAPQHPKSALQELAAARGGKAPEYEVVRRSGPHHAPVFTIRVAVKGLGEATAQGSSKQEAETAAAEALLSQLK